MKKTFDPTKPVRTRDGRPARIIATDKASRHTPIVALVTRSRDPSKETTMHFRADGTLGAGIANVDLVNIPERREGWINIYPPSWDEIASSLHPNKTEADEQASSDRIACIHVSFEEGEGI